jgi:hemerythrin superfamily protein
MPDVHMSTAEGMTGARADAIELLTAEHREQEQLFTVYEASKGDARVAKETADRIVREMSVHAVIEEMVLYPALRRWVEGGDELAEHGLEEHEEMKQLLAEVDGKPGDDPGVRETMGKVKEINQDHIHDEEDKIFPALKRVVKEDKLMVMGEAMAKAKKLAPTHPHPKLPDEPPGNLIVGVPIAIVDRIRDALRGVVGS